jgi:hypothetical protein
MVRTREKTMIKSTSCHARERTQTRTPPPPVPTQTVTHMNTVSGVGDSQTQDHKTYSRTLHVVMFDTIR